MNHAFASTISLHSRAMLFCGLLGCIGQPSAAQQPAPPAATSPAKQPASQPPPPPEPTLDELLGLPKSAGVVPKSPDGLKPPVAPTIEDTGQNPGATSPKDAAKAELDRKLSATEAKDEFEEAVKLMDDTAKRLTTDGDAGLDTQRMQQQVLLKLDKIIDQAQKQKSKSKSKSKSQQQSSDSQSQAQKQSSQTQQQQQQQSPSSRDGMPNTAQASGKLNPPPGTGAAWGNLPDRVREALMQGSGDYTSAKYEALTREYYKRLAEQPTANGTNK